MLLNASPLKKIKTKTPTGQMHLWFLIAIGFSLVGLLCSCGSSNYGKLQSSHDITQMFEKAQVLPDHVYYYSGLEGVPDAIIGIHSSYDLREKRWSQVDFNHERLKKWTYRMRYVHLVAPQGAYIVGPGGDRVGIWFSAQRHTPVRLNRANRLVVTPPLPPELRGVP